MLLKFLAGLCLVLVSPLALGQMPADPAIEKEAEFYTEQELNEIAKQMNLRDLPIGSELEVDVIIGVNNDCSGPFNLQSIQCYFCLPQKTKKSVSLKNLVVSGIGSSKSDGWDVLPVKTKKETNLTFACNQAYLPNIIELIKENKFKMKVKKVKEATLKAPPAKSKGGAVSQTESQEQRKPANQSK